MRKYDYLETIKEDVRSYMLWNDIRVNNRNKREVEDMLNESLFINDSVTGNASGSYTFNAWQAEEYLCHNMELLEEACNEFCDDMGAVVKRGAETCDVIIRCYLLAQAIAEVLDEMEEEEEEERDEDELKIEGDK